MYLDSNSSITRILANAGTFDVEILTTPSVITSPGFEKPSEELGYQ